MGIDLRIDAEGYEPATLSVPGGRYVVISNLQRTVRLLPKDAASLEDSRVEVTVLAAAKNRPGDAPGPLGGARVGGGRATARTDAQGKARIEYGGLVGVELRIEAEGYEPATLRIAGGDPLPDQRR